MEPEKTPRERAEDLIRLLVPDWRPTPQQVLWGIRVAVVLGATDQPNDRAQPTNRAGADLLYQEMQERIRYLESQVEEEREARRRADTLLARLMDRLPELEAPQDASDSPETVSEEPEGEEPRPATVGAQEDVRRPWWRRVFGR